MGNFDFENARAPDLAPLNASFAQNDVEAELKQLTLALWRANLADQAFDANVSGMAHLGSFGLIRRTVNQDGLALLPKSGTEEGTRYIYRAWKARNHRARGMHFLRTYMQILFPGVSKVEQLWMPIEAEYPAGVFSILPEDDYEIPRISDRSGLKLDGKWNVGGMINTSIIGEDGSWNYDTSGLVLTSRVRITLDFSLDVSGAGSLLQIVRNILPARFVPEFRHAITAEIQAEPDIEKVTGTFESLG